MEKKGVKIGNKFIPVETGGVIPMTEKEWNDFQKEIKVERDYFYMVGDNKYVHYGDEDYIRVSDIEKELSKAREEGKVEERDRIFWELDGINCVDEALPKNYSAAGMQFGINRVKEIVLQEELSKLRQ